MGDMLNEQRWRKIFKDVVVNGRYVSPRGKKVIEIEDYSYVLPPYVRFCNFVDRKLNMDYVRREFLWYLRGDRFDISITEHAKMWKGLVNADGGINSNYGQYVFGDVKQFDNVVKTLSDDRDSRRASIVILNSGHLSSETRDVPCTYALNFRIRQNDLNMSVAMRSQDAVFGMGNDAPAFSFIHEMVQVALTRVYPELELGTYHHSANSFHVYERHFNMLERLSGHSLDLWEHCERTPYVPVDCPRISSADEVDFLRACDFSSIPEGFSFARWLNDIKTEVREDG